MINKKTLQLLIIMDAILTIGFTIIISSYINININESFKLIESNPLYNSYDYGLYILIIIKIIQIYLIQKFNILNYQNYILILILSYIVINNITNIYIFYINI